MTDIRTWAQIRAKVKDDMDLNDEVFIDDPELLQIANNGIDEAEAEIHRLYEDYFLKPGVIALASGTQDYALPSDIYASKIRFLFWKDGENDIYEIREITLMEIPSVKLTDVNVAFRYKLINSTAAAGIRIRFFPIPQATYSTQVNIYYIRNANRITADADNVDIPEFHTFVEAFIKQKVAEKENNPFLQAYIAELEKQRELMKTTLSSMIPNENATLPQDMSFYSDFNDIGMVDG